jgi:hypothetical protein
VNTYKTKIELFRIIDSLPEVMVEDLYELLSTKSNIIEEPLSEWQKKDISMGLKDLEEGRKMDFNDFIAAL